MFGTALIVFREVLEAALVISIVTAATRGFDRNLRWISAGVAAGVAGSIVIALLADAISQLASGMGQELFNAGVLVAAVALISWHVLWMSSHGRELSAELKKVGVAVASGARPPSVLLVVVALAVLREGSEVVLFLYGLAAGGTSISGIVIGSGIGVAAGVAAGVALYGGLLRIPAGRMFSATNGLLTLVASGMASQAGRLLVQADLLPTLGSPLWDTSAVVSNGSTVGQVLHALFGYDARPCGMQMVFFVATLLLVGVAILWRRRQPGPVARGKPTRIASVATR